MKKLSLLAFAILLMNFSYGQLSGTYTIPGTPYATIAAAIADLNTLGVSGPVTFNVAVGYTETFTTLTAGLINLPAAHPSSATCPVIFQKSGTGYDPLIISCTPGVSTSLDYIICIAGDDYITFDGIGLLDNPSNTNATMQMEWGYALVKKSSVAPFDGCQNVTIKRCGITLNHANTASVGIYSGNHVSTSTTPLAITATTDACNNCRFEGNYMLTPYSGIRLNGYAAPGPYTLYDQNNNIGEDIGNMIDSFGGGASTAYGIYVTNQNGIKVANNTVYGGAGTTAGIYGIYLENGFSSSADINNNHILNIAGGGSTASFFGIANSLGSSGAGNTINIHDNMIQNCSYPTATTAPFYGIYNNATAATVNIYANTISGNTLPGTGTFYGISNFSISTPNLNIYGNTVSDNTKSGPGGVMNCITISALSTSLSVHDNSIFNNSMPAVSAGNGIIYGFTIQGSTSSENIFNNSIHDLSVGGGTSTPCNIYGLYCLANTSTVKKVYSNKISNLSITASAGGNVYGILENHQGPVNIYKNEICNLSSGGTAGTVIGISLTPSTGTNFNIYNNFVGNLYTPAASGMNAIVGIYAYSFSNYNLFYNTIYIDATSSSANTFGTSCICFPNASIPNSFNCRNNILVNLSSPGHESLNNQTLGIAACLRRESGTWGTVPVNYATTSNNNVYWCNPSAGTNNHLTYCEGTTGTSTNPCNTVAVMKAFFVNRDQASIAENPNFLSTTCSDAAFLHINPATQTGIECGASNISSYTDDYDGDVRQGNPGYTGTGLAPDIGADEFEGIIPYCTTPAPGNTISTINSFCLGQSITLSLQNATAGIGVSYQWQSSADGITYTDITGANSATYSTTPATMIFFRCIVTCQNGPVSVTSNPVQVNLAHSVISTTPGSRCGPGAVTLEATGNTGAILYWYTGATGGTPVGTGSPWSTPTITSTTNYYVEAGNGSAGTATIGAGASTSSNYQSPFYHGYGGFKSQYLVRASELSAAGLSAGTITALSFEVVNSGIFYNSFNLSIGHTSLTQLTTAFQTGLSTVYSAESVFPTAGIYTINFNVPFVWDGSSNLIIETCWSNNNSGNNGTGPSATVKYDNPGFVSESYYMVNNQPASVLCAATTATSTLSARPKMKFAGQSCSSPRSGAVVATVTPPPELTITGSQAVCIHSVTAITVTSTLSNFDLYYWTPVTNLFANASCTTPYVAGTSAATVYFKPTTLSAATYTCSATNTSTLCTNVQSSTMTIKPLPTAGASNNSPLCSGAALQLTGTTDFGTLFSWTGPNGFTSAAQNPTVSPVPYGGSGNYIFTATFDGCSFSDTTDALINFSPEIIIEPGAPTIVAGDIQQLTTNSFPGYNNGPIVNSPGTGAGGLDESFLQSPLTLYGANMNHLSGHSVADDFTVSGGVWNVNSIEFYGFQAFSWPASPFTGVYVQVWDGDPRATGSSVIWGDKITNRLAGTTFTNIYRAAVHLNSDRPVMRIIANTPGLSLPPGTYWVEYAATGSPLFSEPSTPPVTINGTPATGNALQWDGTAWTEIFGAATSYNQGLPFILTATPVHITWAPVTDLYLDAAATMPYIAGTPATIVWTKPSATITYTATGSTALPCTGSKDVTVTVLAIRTLTLHVFLEGLYNAAVPGTMKEALDFAGGAYFPKWGTGISDKITVELRDVAPGHALVGGPYLAELHTDGTATVTVAGALNANYLIVVKHRNSIDTWSSNPGGESFAGSTISYDFTDAITKAFGSNMKPVAGGHFAIFGGNVNAAVDGIVDGTDMSIIENASTAMLRGYVDADVTGDGIVDGSDMALVDNNSTAVVMVKPVP